MEIIFLLLITLLVLLVLSLVGYGFWALIFWAFRQSNRQPSQPPPPSSRCHNCNAHVSVDSDFCPACGTRSQPGIVSELLKDLAAAERQLQRFHRVGKIDADTYAKLKAEISSERDWLNNKSTPRPQTRVAEEPATTSAGEQETAGVPPSVVGSVIIEDDDIIIEPVPTFYSEEEEPAASGSYEPSHSTKPPRRSFGEVLNTFLEESNIRWGEIIGGLLIIGCSTALVVSLWSEIAQIPVLKFLIFTTVTAALFGVGLYTEHRWKLPTTSRGILTTATLLVPLNFLAIAAVSSGIEQNALLIASELIAPALFLCLVYFAAKVLTPDWPHLLVVGVLGSSVGQLMVRHLASPEIEPEFLIALGLFPLACYVGSSLWMLKKSLADGEISEAESTAIFITLGALTFAAVLPFALLLYKCGPMWLTVMYLAPLISIGGFPLLATGMLVWRRVKEKKLVATRTIGTSLALIGTGVVVVGLILAWPNPASIVPAALFNFAVFTALAILLRLPSSHIPAAFCLAVAYIVLVQVFAGHVPWQNLRVTSLLAHSLSVSTGQALVPLFVLLVVIAEWLSRRRSRAEGLSYLINACAVAAVSVLLVSLYGALASSSVFWLWLVYGVYAAGSFWITVRWKEPVFGWIGSLLLLITFAQVFAQVIHIPFPWQTAFLTHATVCALAAVITSKYLDEPLQILTKQLNDSALISSFLAVICFVQAGPWQSTAMQAESLFWLCGIWLLLLWLNRRHDLFVIFQITLTLALVVAVKAALQQYAWYSYLPHAWLHPWGLQIQGTVLLFMCLAWVAIRIAINRTSASEEPSIIADLRRLLGTRFSIDRLVLWTVLGGFVLLTFYGALSGLISELTQRETGSTAWNIAGFSHEQVLRLGSWIVLALLVIAMLSNLWERRRSFYLFGALAALLAAIPLLAGTWEPQTATASAWRWLAVIALILFSLPLWFYRRVAERLKALGWPATELSSDELSKRTRLLLLVLTVTPLLILGFQFLISGISLQPIHGPSSGIFAALDDRFSHGLPLVLVSLVLIIYAVRDKLYGYAFAAGPFLNLTVTIAYVMSYVAINGKVNFVLFANVVVLNVLTCALYGLLWLKPLLSLGNENDRKDAVEYFEIQAGITLALALLMMLTALGETGSAGYPFALAWTALVATLALIFSCLWFREIKHALPGLYVAGLFAIGLGLLQSRLPPNRLSWATTLALAVYTVFVSVLWYSRSTLREWTQRLRTPQPSEVSSSPPDWLVIFNTILSVVVVLLAFRIELKFLSFPLRATVAIAVVLLSLSFALISEGVAADKLRRTTVLLLVTGITFLGWSVLVPGITGTWFNRAVILMVEMFVLTAVVDLFLNRSGRDSVWNATLQTCVPWFIAVGVSALLFSLSTEVFYQVRFGAVRIASLALIAIAMTLAGAIGISLLFALSPTYDPLKLSERGRMNYVYAAEVLLALLFVHIRLTLPWLFTGFFERYWPLVVMAIAYLGVAISETLRRRELLVLSTPLERTGAFLPLLPVFGFWLARSEVDYSMLLFIVGGLYGLLSILRRSFAFGLLAALAGNVGLWYLWHRSANYHFLQHPQLWLVPVAASVLVAAYLNEDDFTEEQMAGIRYLSLITIYASSTADIFINGVADSPWLPLILAAFSLAGVFAGIIFKIRGFLMLGSVFLLLAIVTMIWYASANLGWTWLWYVAGIVTGATIIFMFAVFEKKRSEVLRVVEGFKEWER